MGFTAKNRLVLKFDKAGNNTVKLTFGTLEQACIFSYYLQKCSTVPYVSISREIKTNDGWLSTSIQECIHDKDYIEKRSLKSPFKLHVRILTTKTHEEFCFDFYAFESSDIDHINMLLVRGIPAKEVCITSYRRDRETGDWLQYECCKLVPATLADLYNGLSISDRADAIEYLRKLNSVR